MLDSLRGKLLAIGDGRAVVDVNGLRFALEIPKSTETLLGAAGAEVEVLTRLSLNTNEGNFLLFGFATEVERECFDIFTGITGIGPRKGINILSQIEIGSFARAIVNRDLSYLSKIKGVGAKTAERLVVELREKMLPYSAPTQLSPAVPNSLPVKDAIEALIALGCKPAIAEKAIIKAHEELGAKATSAELLRAGLRHR